MTPSEKSAPAWFEVSPKLCSTRQHHKPCASPNHRCVGELRTTCHPFWLVQTPPPHLPLNFHPAPHCHAPCPPFSTRLEAHTRNAFSHISLPPSSAVSRYSFGLPLTLSDPVQTSTTVPQTRSSRKARPRNHPSCLSTIRKGGKHLCDRPPGSNLRLLHVPVTHTAPPRRTHADSDQVRALHLNGKSRMHSRHSLKVGNAVRVDATIADLEPRGRKSHGQPHEEWQDVSRRSQKGSATQHVWWSWYAHLLVRHEPRADKPSPGPRNHGGRHSVGDFRSSSRPAANVQNYYAAQRYQGRPSEPDQMMQAKRRMAAQRERELRNYHQEQQYNRSALLALTTPDPADPNRPSRGDGVQQI